MGTRPPAPKRFPRDFCNCELSRMWKYILANGDSCMRVIARSARTNLYIHEYVYVYLPLRPILNHHSAYLYACHHAKRLMQLPYEVRQNLRLFRRFYTVRNLIDGFKKQRWRTALRFFNDYGRRDFYHDRRRDRHPDVTRVVSRTYPDDSYSTACALCMRISHRACRGASKGIYDADRRRNSRPGIFYVGSHMREWMRWRRDAVP